MNCACSGSHRHNSGQCARYKQNQRTGLRCTSIAVTVAQAHVQDSNLVHLMRGQVANAPLLTVPLSFHIRLSSAQACLMMSLGVSTASDLL